jgi:hypothetical protein
MGWTEATMVGWRFGTGSQLGTVCEDGSRRHLLGIFGQGPGSHDVSWSPEGRRLAVFKGPAAGCDTVCRR